LVAGGRYELTVSTWQMCVLALFNSAAARAAGVPFSAMCAALPSVPREELQRHVLSLMTPKLRILVKGSRSKEIADEDVFSANGAFESRFLRIKVPLVSMRSAVSSGATGAAAAVAAAAAAAAGAGGGGAGGSGGGSGGGGGAAGSGSGAAGGGDDEGADVAAQLENQRKNMIEAAIVRIMKSRKTLDHANLVAEVTRQLSARFRVSPPDIKRRIEGLLEREYLERDKSDARVYTYLA
jgi:cullin 3